MGRWLLDLGWVGWYVSHFGRQINCDVGCKEGEEENDQASPVGTPIGIV